jgi:endonuclease/exonuclease/phosphatase family metal-dependent hydrolase
MRFKVSPCILGIAVFVLALLAGGCGGGSTTGSSLSSQPQIIVRVSPGSVSLPEGQKQQFTATVSGTTNAAVTWSSSSGTISTSGLFTAPTVSASTIVTVVATSEADTTKSASAAVTVTTPASSLTTLKVMQMNVQHGYGTDNVHDTSRQTSWPANLGADVFSMNEVTYGDSGSGVCTNGVCDCTNSTHLRDVENQTGKTWHCLFMQDYPEKGEGNMILSSIEPISTATHQYPSTSHSGANTTMSAIEMTLSVNSKNICYFATHLDWLSESNRELQVNDLLFWMGSSAFGSCNAKLLLGDMNSQDYRREMGDIRNAGYTDVWHSYYASGKCIAYPDNPVARETRTRRSRLDMIYYKNITSGTLGVNACQIPDSRVPPAAIERIGTSDDDGTRPSDHNFYMVTFASLQ